MGYMRCRPGRCLKAFYSLPKILSSFSSADGSSGLENLFVGAGSRLVLQLLSIRQSGGGVVPQPGLPLGFDLIR